MVMSTRRPSRPKPKPGEIRPVLMSIQPQYVQQILDGDKTVELRRQQSGCLPGTPLSIYTSFPVKRVQVQATVKQVHALPVDELWQQYGQASATSKKDFYEYLGDLDIAYGIELHEIQEVPPLPLFRSGPQSWRYLFSDEQEGQLVLGHVAQRA